MKTLPNKTVGDANEQVNARAVNGIILLGVLNTVGWIVLSALGKETGSSETLVVAVVSGLTGWISNHPKGTSTVTTGNADTVNVNEAPPVAPPAPPVVPDEEAP